MVSVTNNDLMLSVIMLNVVVLSVVAPQPSYQPKKHQKRTNTLAYFDEEEKGYAALTYYLILWNLIDKILF